MLVVEFRAPRESSKCSYLRYFYVLIFLSNQSRVFSLIVRNGFKAVRDGIFLIKIFQYRKAFRCYRYSICGNILNECRVCYRDIVELWSFINDNRRLCRVTKIEKFEIFNSDCIKRICEREITSSSPVDSNNELLLRIEIFIP